ncbi:CehA/McbA family metallohydrolase [Sphingomonas sp.]|uniref:CehA/McbA family metallohydrolase n=1 Tax=Sphingomonas sp. TaxID=28214 RepID=UPI0025F4A462|nr:CehA/McbA family metallohydrolase [Sphingomonas sp.]
MRGAVLAALALALAVLAPGRLLAQEAGPAPWRTLSGAITRADYEHYHEVPFDLPEGVTRLTIRVRYGKEQHTVVDLGLADPQRFRGWSGGTRDAMTLSVEDATPGYLPGPLPAGQWRLILGVPNIRLGVEARFEAQVFIERQPVVQSFADRPINPAPGWYRGDLHMHSGNSDGKCLSQAGEKVPCPVYRTVATAAERGLDFIALTDHNTTAHYAALRELQGAFDRLLLVPGREVTTFQGHSNVFGPTDFLDFRTLAPSYAEAAKWMDAVKREGGLVSINHPGAPSGEICMGCGWRIDDLPEGAVQAVEVVNGGTMAETGSAESPLQGFAFWHKLLNAGRHVTAIGGSDNHNAGIPLDKLGAIGTPTTVVHMEALSLQGLLDGIRAGRVFIDVQGSRDRLLDLSATSGGQTAAMGGTLSVARGRAVRFTAEVKGVTGGAVQLIIDGKADPAWRKGIAADGSITMPEWRSDGGRHWVRADVGDGSGALILVGNPIYVEPR